MIANYTTYESVGQFQHVTRQCPRGRLPSAWPRHPDTRWAALPRPRATLHGLGFTLGQDWLVSLFGKPQAWYDRISKLQSTINAQMREMAEFGEEVWNRLARSRPDVLPPYTPQMQDMTNRIKGIIVRQNYTPPDSAINLAEQGAAAYAQRNEFVKKSIPPAAAAAATQAGQEVYANLMRSPMRSPATVGVETFKKDVAERAEKLVTGRGLPLWVYAGIALAALFGIGYAIRAVRK